MVKEFHANGYDECSALISQHKQNPEGFFLLFSGLPWCPDCVKAEPVIDEAISTVTSDAVFVHVDVGDRAYWKNPANSFRTDSTLKVKSVPTLLKFGTPKRLEEEQCCDVENVKMLFED